MNKSERCVANTRDGSRCGRRVTDNSFPPICHVHRLQAQGQSHSPLTAPLPFDVEEKIIKIAADDRHEHQMQAIKLLRSERDSCPTCRARDDRYMTLSELCDRATQAQLEEMRTIITHFRELKLAIGAQPSGQRTSDRNQAGTTLGTDGSVTLAGGTESSLPAEPECLEAGADRGQDQDRSRAEGSSNRRQPKADDHACADAQKIVPASDDPLGDQHALDVAEGRIPAEDKDVLERRSQRMTLPAAIWARKD